MEEVKFYSKNEREIPVSRLNMRDVRITKAGDIQPKRNKDGKEIIGYRDAKGGEKPITKVKFRKSSQVPGDITWQLKMAKNRCDKLQKYLDNKSEELKKDLQEIVGCCPHVVEFIEQVCLRHSEIVYDLGRWDGMRYLSGQRFTWPTWRNFTESVVKVKDGKEWLTVTGEEFPEEIKLLLKPIFI